jgi:hypothetical protein
MRASRTTTFRSEKLAATATEDPSREGFSFFPDGRGHAANRKLENRLHCKLKSLNQQGLLRLCGLLDPTL